MTGKSRRDFLKVSGAGLAGVAVGSPERMSTMVQPGELSPAGAKDAERRESAFDIKAFGAKGDGTTIDTPAINKLRPPQLVYRDHDCWARRRVKPHENPFRGHTLVTAAAPLISSGVAEEPAPPWRRGSLTRVAYAKRRRSRSLTPLPFGCAGFGMVYREEEISSPKEQAVEVTVSEQSLSSKPMDHTNR